MMKVYSRTLTAQEGNPIGATTEVQEFSDLETVKTVIQVKAEIALAPWRCSRASVVPG